MPYGKTPSSLYKHKKNTTFVEKPEVAEESSYNAWIEQGLQITCQIVGRANGCSALEIVAGLKIAFMTDFPIITGMACGAALLLGFEIMINSRRVNVIANRWLGLFVITVGLALLEMVLALQNFQELYPKVFELVSLSRFLTAPALYLAIISFTSLKPGIKYAQLWHFAPFVVLAGFRIPFFITGQNFDFSPGAVKGVLLVLATALPLQTILYWALSLWKLDYHMKTLQLFASSTEKNGLVWLRNFLLIVGIIVLAWFNIAFFRMDALIPYTPVLYLFCLFFLAFFSIQQKEIFDFTSTEKVALSEIGKQNTVAGGRQKRLSDGRFGILNQKLEYLIAIEQVHLDNGLSLPSLASKMDATPNETSYLINETYKENFYNFINRLRIEEAKALLLSGKFSKLNIIGIAYQSGFNSKSTFNATFKKHTGLTPTQFVKQNAPQTA